MKSKLQMVRDFHVKFRQDAADKPAEMTASIASLRKKLVTEEARELVDAIDQGDLHDQLDALCDLLYVTYGTAIAMGMSAVLDEAFERVHDANMRKVLAPSRLESKRDNPWDVIKPEGWTKPDLHDLVEPCHVGDP